MNHGDGVLVVAPHPDDETLGCGGTLLKLKKSGYELHWLIMTSADQDSGYTASFSEARRNEILTVANKFEFASVHQLAFPASRLDAFPLGEIVKEIAKILHAVKPRRIYAPFRGDVHSDHRVVFDAVVSASKSFRADFLREIYIYETLSETEFGINPTIIGFRPNLFEDITEVIEQKIEIMSLYKSETGLFPFPRSNESIMALAKYRGTQSNNLAAESFMIIKELR